MTDIKIRIEHDNQGRPALIVNIPHTNECAACGMDDSMQSDLKICLTCNKCLHWEDEFGPGRCCTCPKPIRTIDEIYARNPADD